MHNNPKKTHTARQPTSTTKMYMRRTSQPINIESSSSVDPYSHRRSGHGTSSAGGQTIPIQVHSNARDSDSDDESDSDSDERLQHRLGMTMGGLGATHHRHHQHSPNPPHDDDCDIYMESSLSASYGRNYGHLNRNNTNMNIHRSFDNMNLTVGSLPSSRRERRFMVSHGNNERHAFHAPNTSGSKTGSGLASSFSNRAHHMNGHIHGNGQGYGQGYGHGRHEEDLSRSMPGMLRAPFLHSRKDRATDTRLSRIPSMRLPESVTDGSEASSVPYGSLNESQFRMPSSIGGGDGSYSTKVRFADHNKGPTLDIQKRVQEMKKNGTLMKNGEGGLASLLGSGGANNNNHNNGDVEDTTSDSQESDSIIVGGGGIGSSLTNANDGTNKREGFVSSLSSLVNKLEGNHDRQTEEKRNRRREGGGGGIGSLLETSHISAQGHEDDDEVSMPSNINLLPTQSMSGTTLTTGARSSVGGISSALGVSLSAENIHTNSISQTTTIQQLSSSMTGLSILKTSPKGDIVHLSLSPQDRVALTSRCTNTDVNGNADNMTSRAATGAIENSFLVGIGTNAAGMMQERRYSNESDYSHHHPQQHHNHHLHAPSITIGGSGDDDQDEFFNMDL